MLCNINIILKYSKSEIERVNSIIHTTKLYVIICKKCERERMDMKKVNVFTSN